MTKIDDGFYNYISQKQKFFRFLANSFFFLICVFLLIFYKSIFSDQNVSFYTFSTIVQGFLALIAFLGAVAVFKLQLIENEAQKISNGLESSVRDYRGVVVHSYSWIEMMNACSKILENKDFSNNVISSGYEKLCRLRDEKSPIRSKMVDFSLASLVNIVVALLGIPFSKLLTVHGLVFIDAIYIVFNITLSYASTLSAFRLIRLCLGYSFKI